MKLACKIGTAVSVLLMFSSGGFRLNAQDLGNDYISKTGLFTRIYSGKIESSYSPRLYRESPYYGGKDYVEGSIVFDNILYPGLIMRLDLYKQQVVVFSPANQAIAFPKRVQKVYIYGKTFIWVVPSEDCGLKREGFYISYLDGKKLKLLCEERIFIHDQKAMPLVFESNTRYYLGINGKYYHVRNKSDFLRLFPEHKKQINKYARDSQLDFIYNKEQSMTALAAFCDKL